MTKEEIREWLDSIGKDRFWLAEQIGATKGTVDQWFYRGFPDWAVKSVQNLKAAPVQDDGGLQVKFSHTEWTEITEARQNAGYLTLREFYHDAIVEFAREINEEQKAKPTQETDDIALVSEKPAKKWGGKQKSA